MIFVVHVSSSKCQRQADADDADASNFIHREESSAWGERHFRRDIPPLTTLADMDKRANGFEGSLQDMAKSV